MMCFSECCGGESHLRLPQSSGNQQTQYYSSIYSCYDIHTTCSFTLKVLSIILRWNGYVKKQTFLISIIFLFSLCLHQSKWTKGTRSISCALWAEADGGLLDWCWYTSCGRTEGRWHVYHRQSTDLRTEYTCCRQTTGWVCFIYRCHTNHHSVLPINATFQLMLNMCLCYCKNTLILFGRSVSLHLFNFLSCYSSNYMHVYWHQLSVTTNTIIIFWR